MQPTKEWVERLVEEAQNLKGFVELPAGREKSDTVWLMELASVPAARPRAMQALLWLQEQRENTGKRLGSAMAICSLHLPDTRVSEDHEEWVRLMPEVGEQAQEQRRRIHDSLRITPFVYEPVKTELGEADRHPWHGLAGPVTFGDVGAGSGLFAAVFAEVGATCGFLAEPKGDARERAVSNCRGTPVVLDTIQQVDPAYVPWVHVLQGGPE